ncbi:MAG: tol-pal system protein YbgF [Cycloclasticus sp.]
MITKKQKGRLVAALLLMSGAASAALPPVIDGRGQIAPPPASTSSMLGMYNRLEQLQNDVQQMRGQIEEQAHTIESLKKRQRDLYLDTDRRIQQLETGQTSSPVSSSELPANTTSAISSRPSAAPASTNSGEDKLAYEAAFASLKAARYEQSISDFSAFIAAYPKSSYLPNALYWLGEASYVTRDFKRALKEFNEVVARFPAHSKTKDALLKIGFIQYENKQWQQSRATLEKVLTSYPGATVAQLAGQRLEKMRQEKH